MLSALYRVQGAARWSRSWSPRSRSTRSSRSSGPRASTESARAGTGALTGASSTGIPFSTALPESASSSSSSASMLLLVPGVLGGDPHELGPPGASWPQPWGRLTTPGMIASVTSTGAYDRPRARADLGLLAVDELVAVGVVGVDVKRALRRSLDEQRQVVHPRVVRAKIAAADEHERRRCAASARSPARAARRRRRAARARARSSRSAVRSASGSRGFSGPRSIPCGRVLEVGERELVRAGAELQVEQPLGPDARRELGQHLVLACGRRTATRRSRARARSALRATCSSSIATSASGPSPNAMPGEPQERHPFVGDRSGRAAAPAASSSRRCGPRTGTARGRSASGAAARGRAGSRRRGGSSR